MRKQVVVSWRRWNGLCEERRREREAAAVRVGAEEAKEEMVALCRARARLRMRARCKRSLVLWRVFASSQALVLTRQRALLLERQARESEEGREKEGRRKVERETEKMAERVGWRGMEREHLEVPVRKEMPVRKIAETSECCEMGTEQERAAEIENVGKVFPEGREPLLGRDRGRKNIKEQERAADVTRWQEFANVKVDRETLGKGAGGRAVFDLRREVLSEDEDTVSLLRGRAEWADIGVVEERGDEGGARFGKALRAALEAVRLGDGNLTSGAWEEEETRTTQSGVNISEHTPPPPRSSEEFQWYWDDDDFESSPPRICQPAVSSFSPAAAATASTPKVVTGNPSARGGGREFAPADNWCGSDGEVQEGFMRAGRKSGLVCRVQSEEAMELDVTGDEDGEEDEEDEERKTLEQALMQLHPAQGASEIWQGCTPRQNMAQSGHNQTQSIHTIIHSSNLALTVRNISNSVRQRFRGSGSEVEREEDGGQVEEQEEGGIFAKRYQHGATLLRHSKECAVRTTHEHTHVEPVPICPLQTGLCPIVLLGAEEGAMVKEKGGVEEELKEEAEEEAAGKFAATLRCALAAHRHEGHGERSLRAHLSANKRDVDTTFGKCEGGAGMRGDGMHVTRKGIVVHESAPACDSYSQEGAAGSGLGEGWGGVSRKERKWVDPKKRVMDALGVAGASPGLMRQVVAAVERTRRMQQQQQQKQRQRDAENTDRNSPSKSADNEMPPKLQPLTPLLDPHPDTLHIQTHSHTQTLLPTEGHSSSRQVRRYAMMRSSSDDDDDTARERESARTRAFPFASMLFCPLTSPRSSSSDSPPTHSSPPRSSVTSSTSVPLGPGYREVKCENDSRREMVGNYEKGEWMGVRATAVGQLQLKREEAERRRVLLLWRAPCLVKRAKNIL